MSTLYKKAGIPFQAVKDMSREQEISHHKYWSTHSPNPIVKNFHMKKLKEMKKEVKR